MTLQLFFCFAVLQVSVLHAENKHVYRRVSDTVNAGSSWDE